MDWQRLRIGNGWDVHALVKDRPLILGGVAIPYDWGLAGHSDADVLCHALMDALLGAAGMGDIGGLFPDSDEAYRGAHSLGLLAEVGRRLAGEGWVLLNADTTILAQRPKLAPYKERMSSNMAQALGVAQWQVGVKATTTEGLGFVGRGEGIAASAVAMLLYGDEAKSP
jgi:2-C-methyl-D-erythritol 2,4-cyclodiphosphate synthase